MCNILHDIFPWDIFYESRLLGVKKFLLFINFNVMPRHTPALSPKWLCLECCMLVIIPQGTNTFQAVVIGDGSKERAIVVYIYDKLDWKRTYRAGMGFHGYTANSISGATYNHPFSRKRLMYTLTSRSNTGNFILYSTFDYCGSMLHAYIYIVWTVCMYIVLLYKSDI